MRSIDGAGWFTVQLPGTLQWAISEAQNYEENTMATRYIGYARGDVRATGDSSTTSKEIELVINDAVGITPRELDAALSRIKQEFMETNGFTE